VYRGGGWNVGAASCRAAMRESAPPEFRKDSLMGFRVARTIDMSGGVN
jgi:formylglycine-generating enzyme required for sulfatase activity